MNFLDSYDITRSATPNPNPPNQPEQPSLNEEVNQVMGQLGRLWGGFRKQGQTALETARKDFSSVVVQAQKEISKLTTVPDTADGTGSTDSTETTTAGSSNATASIDKAKSTDAGGSAGGDAAEAPSSRAANQPSDTSTTTEQVGGSTATPATVPSSSSSSRSLNEQEPDSGLEPQQPTASTSGASSARNTFFSRIQSALPPTVLTTLQEHIPASLKSASIPTPSLDIDFNQMRSNLATEFQRVQGVTLAQAEEYVHKSEALWKEAVKEASEVLREAVKVIPPEEQQEQQVSGTGLVWDGTDIWMVPSASFGGDDSGSSGAAEAGLGAGQEKGKSPVTAKRKETQSAVATRAEALLKRLKHDPEILRHDPEAEVHEEYVKWRTAEVDTVQSEGGVLGSEVWKGRIKAALDEEGDGEALKALKETLVPAELTEEAFWMRFFFRSHQIRAEEEKRKALIQSSTETDDDFSWEDDDDEPTSATHPKPAASPNTSSNTLATENKAPKAALSPNAVEASSANASRRVSSEDSFDMVSSTSMSVLGDENTTPKANKTAAATTTKAAAEDDEDEDDSDWE